MLLILIPVILLIQTESREDTLKVWQETVELHGAITAGVYSNDEDYLEKQQNKSWHTVSMLTISLHIDTIHLTSLSCF